MNDLKTLEGEISVWPEISVHPPSIPRILKNCERSKKSSSFEMTRSMLHTSFRSRSALPTPARFARRISEYLREITRP
jgi:hypothetical protein